MNAKLMVMGFAALCTAIVASATPARAQQDSALLDALVKKGVLSDQEAEDIRASEEKDYSSTAASKINLSSSIKSITFYGDLRLRFEEREGMGGPGAALSSANAPEGHSDGQDDQRWRYRLRFGVKGDLYDQFFYGLRLATNPYYDRSGNVTFGAADAAGPFGKGQSLLAIDQVFLGWHATPDITLTGGQMPNPLYTTNLVWDDNLNPMGAAEQFDHTYDNVEVFATAGQFVYQAASGNGFTNTVAGTVNYNNTFMYAEQIGMKYKIDENTFFKGAATLYTYSNTESGDAGGTVASLYSDTPLNLSNAALNTGTGALPGAVGAAPGPYTYPAGAPTGQENRSPSYFNGPFVGSLPAPVSNVSGINDLAVLEFPMEFDFRIGPGIHSTTVSGASTSDSKDMKAESESTTVTSGWSLPMRFFADFAYNLEADERANAARAAENAFITGTVGGTTTGYNNQGVDGATTAAGNYAIIHSPGFQGVLNSGKGFLDAAAYQIGTEVGQLKKKGDWDGKLYWQSTGYYAVDPNLIDADIFNAATNLQGVVVSGSYNWTDGLSSTLRYAHAFPVNGQLATPNVNQDLTLGDIRQYDLFQADLMWKF